MIELPLFGLSHRANSSHILKVGYIVNLACSTKQCNACSLQTVPHVVKCSMHWNRFSEFGWRTGPPPPPAHQNKERERKNSLLKYYSVQVTIVVKHSGQKDRQLTMSKSAK